jgi:hypothetical protein
MTQSHSTPKYLAKRKKTYTHAKACCIWKFTAALFVILQTVNNPNFHQGMDKQTVISIEHYSEMRRNQYWYIQW